MTLFLSRAWAALLPAVAVKKTMGINLGSLTHQSPTCCAWYYSIFTSVFSVSPSQFAPPHIPVPAPTPPPPRPPHAAFTETAVQAKAQAGRARGYDRERRGLQSLLRRLAVAGAAPAQRGCPGGHPRVRGEGGAEAAERSPGLPQGAGRQEDEGLPPRGSCRHRAYLEGGRRRPESVERVRQWWLGLDRDVVGGGGRIVGDGEDVKDDVVADAVQDVKDGIVIDAVQDVKDGVIDPDQDRLASSSVGPKREASQEGRREGVIEGPKPERRR